MNSTLTFALGAALAVMVGAIIAITVVTVGETPSTNTTTEPTPFFPQGSTQFCSDDGSLFQLDSQGFEDFEDARTEAEEVAGRQLPIPPPGDWVDGYSAGEQTVYVRDARQSSTSDEDAVDAPAFVYRSVDGARNVVIEFNPAVHCRLIDRDTVDVSVGSRTVEVARGEFQGARSSSDGESFEYVAQEASFESEGLWIHITLEWEEAAAPSRDEQQDERRIWIEAVLEAFDD
jgi:hypothetical protein